MDDVEYRQLDRLANDGRFFAHVMLRGFVLCSAWAAAAAFMSPGTILGVIQVMLFLMSIAFVGFGAHLFFRSRLSSLGAVLASVGTWLFWTVVYRSLLLHILGVR